MNELMDLYQELIIDHARSPRNFGRLATKSHDARGANPLCGDTLELELLVDNNIISQIVFLGDGCAISKASASLMTEALKGKSVEQAWDFFNSFHAMLVDESDDTSLLGKLNALKGVRQFPVRVKCATLCWHTLSAALKKDHNSASTE